MEGNELTKKEGQLAKKEDEPAKKGKKPARKRKPRIKCDYEVKLYEDGKYHWLYDLNLLKNPSVLIDVYKALGITLLITGLILLLIQACTNGLHAQDFIVTLQIIGLLTGIMVVLGLLAYLLYAAISGWTYSVHFIMDEKGVEHRQAPRSQKVARRIGILTTLIGLFASKPGVAGTGMLSASRMTMSTTFASVRKVKAKRRMNTIMVNEPFGKNRVYVRDEDFDFVYGYISSHCPNAAVS